MWPKPLMLLASSTLIYDTARSVEQRKLIEIVIGSTLVFSTKRQAAIRLLSLGQTAFFKATKAILVRRNA